LIDAFESDKLRNSLPALRVVLGMISPEDGIKLREELNDEVRTDLVSAVKGNSAVLKQLKER
jgi:dihydroorotase